MPATTTMQPVPRFHRLRRFINHPVTDMAVMVLILVSVGVIIAETVVDPGPLQQLLRRVDDGFIAVFVLELSIRFLVAPSKRRFFRIYWLDIVAILPLTRALRILRLLRLLRLFRFGVMLDRRVSRYARVFRRGLEGYVAVVFAIITFVLVGALAITILEGAENQAFDSFHEALWWAVMSLIAGEPIGGEAQTEGGRVVELLLMLGGVTVFAMFTGTVTAMVIQVVGDRAEEINMEIEDLTGHTLVCGWKRGSAGLLAELQEDPVIRQSGIVVVSLLEHEPDLAAAGASADRVFFLKGDHTRVEILKRAGVERISTAIILPDKVPGLSDQDRDARSVLTALVIEKLNRRTFTVVELLNPDNETYLRMAGVEEVLVADRHTARVLGAATRNRGLLGTIRELITSQYGNQFYKMAVPAAWIGKPVGELCVTLKRGHNATLLSIESPDEGAVRVNPAVDEVIRRGDEFVYVAGNAIDPKKLV